MSLFCQHALQTSSDVLAMAYVSQMDGSATTRKIARISPMNKAAVSDIDVYFTLSIFRVSRIVDRS